MFIAKPSSQVPDIRFSTLGHRVLWADANESEQTVIPYLSRTRSRARRARSTGSAASSAGESNQPPEEEPTDYDVLVHDIAAVKLEFWNWKNLEWQDTWDTTQTDGQKRLAAEPRAHHGHRTRTPAARTTSSRPRRGS